MRAREFCLLMVGMLLIAACGDDSPTAPGTDGLAITVRDTLFSLPGGTTMEFVWIEPGTFMMGSPASEAGRDSIEGPQHEVTISRGFWLGRYEITEAQFLGSSKPASQRYCGATLSPDHPVVCLTWVAVQELIARLNAHAGQVAYRLPTEAEWEYACRAGGSALWSSGDDEGLLSDFAWYLDFARPRSLPYAQPVGTRLPNPWGLFDMHGNAGEWVQDWCGDYTPAAQVNPLGPSSGTARSRRGGGFASPAVSTRSAHRSCALPDYRSHGGARLVRTE